MEWTQTPLVLRRALRSIRQRTRETMTAWVPEKKKGEKCDAVPKGSVGRQRCASRAEGDGSYSGFANWTFLLTEKLCTVLSQKGSHDGKFH